VVDVGDAAISLAARRCAGADRRRYAFGPRRRDGHAEARSIGVDGWWTEIEAEIRAVVRHHPTVTLEELARRLGISESGTASILRVLMMGQPTGSSIVR